MITDFGEQVLSHHLKELIGEYGMESILDGLDKIVRQSIDGDTTPYLKELSANIQKTLKNYQRRNDAIGSKSIDAHD